MEIGWLLLLLQWKTKHYCQNISCFTELFLLAAKGNPTYHSYYPTPKPIAAVLHCWAFIYSHKRIILLYHNAGRQRRLSTHCFCTWIVLDYIFKKLKNLHYNEISLTDVLGFETYLSASLLYTTLHPLS